MFLDLILLCNSTFGDFQYFESKILHRYKFDSGKLIVDLWINNFLMEKAGDVATFYSNKNLCLHQVGGELNKFNILFNYVGIFFLFKKEDQESIDDVKQIEHFTLVEMIVFSDGALFWKSLQEISSRQISATWSALTMKRDQMDLSLHWAVSCRLRVLPKCR